MNILIAPDKFKGSLSALEVGNALKKGILLTNPSHDISIHPMADGGDGSIAILTTHMNLKSHEIETVDPLGRPITAAYYTSDDVAFIEMASASGLVLLSQFERNPLVTSTRGTGIIMKDAIEKGYKHIWLFLGGSATNDGGLGIAQVLGFDFLDENGEQLDPIGVNLEKIKGVKNNKLIDHEMIQFTLLCDVTNPMHGPHGASHVFAAQKGAEQWAINKLDDGLKNYDQVLKSQYGMDIAHLSGIGAAGAIGASLVGLCGATMRGGFDMISELTGLEEAISSADLVISGEGKIDSQSLDGKVVSGVAQLCKKHKKPLAIAAGTSALNSSQLKILGTSELYTVMQKAQSIEDAMKNGESYLVEIGKEISPL